MTVRELIEQLSSYPPDWLVFDIDGMSIVSPDGYAADADSGDI